jgi:hypothetical protein
MDKSLLQNYISLNYSTRQIAQLVNRSQTNVRHWLKKYNLKTNLKQFTATDYRCKCGETSPEKFYGHSKQTCSRCHNKKTSKVGRNNRHFAVEHLGGKCLACGYNKHACALDIHHLDPSIKDKYFRNMRSWGKERIFKEIESCVLLCKNCHALVHAGLVELPE